MNARVRNVAAPKLDWVDFNQQALVDEFRRLRDRLEGKPPSKVASPSSLGMAPPAIDRIVHTFGLSGFERALLLLCAGAEMDSALADACLGATGSRVVTFGIAMALLDDPHWSALAPASSLRRWRLIEFQGNHALTECPLRIDERILHYLAGVNRMDARLQTLLRIAEPGLLLSESQAARVRDVATVWDDGSSQTPIVQLIGDDPDGAEDVVAHAAAQLGLQLFVLRAEDVPSTPDEADSFATLWQREAALLPAALLLACADAPTTAPASRLIERVQTAMAVSAKEAIGTRRNEFVVELGKPRASEQLALWQQVVNSSDKDVGEALDVIASQFRFSAHHIGLMGQQLERRIADGEEPARALQAVCRKGGRSRLDELAQRIDAQAGWQELVLPPVQMNTLRQLCAHLHHRTHVYETWGFADRCARGLGISALFCGESGTGKTLAAEVIAAELRLDLYRIDLASIVSKYIGETEKNLRRVFDAAEDSGAILLFDEADALFGKRSDVKDSHDRYANIEVSYLLQRMEAYHGLAILTTNLKAAIDSAFQRRLRFIVHFPFPDVAQREAIWRCAFPSMAPLSGVDFPKLATLHATGGSIHNVAVNAAFFAAEAGDPITMEHILRAARAERAKLERPLADAETRGWV